MFRTTSNVDMPVDTGDFRLLDSRVVKTVFLSPGQHVLAVKTEVGGWPDWVQVALDITNLFFGIDNTRK